MSGHLAPSSSEEGVGGGGAIAQPISANTGTQQTGTVSQAIRAATALLGPSTDAARFDAEVLMAHALGVSRSELFLRRMHDPAPGTFAALIARRAAHEPVAQIRGYQEFFGLTFKITPDTLIPRQGGGDRSFGGGAGDCRAQRRCTGRHAGDPA